MFVLAILIGLSLSSVLFSFHFFYSLLLSSLLFKSLLNSSLLLLRLSSLLFPYILFSLNLYSCPNPDPCPNLFVSLGFLCSRLHLRHQCPTSMRQCPTSMGECCLVCFTNVEGRKRRWEERVVSICVPQISSYLTLTLTLTLTLNLTLTLTLTWFYLWAFCSFLRGRCFWLRRCSLSLLSRCFWLGM